MPLAVAADDDDAPAALSDVELPDLLEEVPKLGVVPDPELLATASDMSRWRSLFSVGGVLCLRIIKGPAPPPHPMTAAVQSGAGLGLMPRCPSEPAIVRAGSSARRVDRRLSPRQDDRDARRHPCAAIFDRSVRLFGLGGVRLLREVRRVNGAEGVS